MEKNDLKRWIKLVEANAALDSPAFQHWFAGSVVKNADGEPTACYHGTTSDIEQPWRPLTHFGTSRAASERIDFVFDEPDDTPEFARLYPVYLRIRNPIRVTDDNEDDDGGGQQIWQALKKLVNRNIINKTEYDDLLQGWRGIDEADHQIKAMHMVARHGFDGLVYRNKVEHPGSTSWVIFDNDQVWPALSRSPT